MEDIEDVLDGNLCRCTGYRPIFDAFKSLAHSGSVQDMEDVLTTRRPNPSRAIGKIASSASIDGDWYYPTSLGDLILVLAQLPSDATYRLVHGNTGRGI